MAVHGKAIPFQHASFAESGSLPPMPFAHLEDRAVILVSGPEAEHFLQNILTVDLDTLEDGEVKPGALLAPQGKILFDFLISRAGPETFRLECRFPPPPPALQAARQSRDCQAGTGGCDRRLAG